MGSNVFRIGLLVPVGYTLTPFPLPHQQGAGKAGGGTEWSLEGAADKNCSENEQFTNFSKREFSIPQLLLNSYVKK